MILPRWYCFPAFQKWLKESKSKIRKTNFLSHNSYRGKFQDRKKSSQRKQQMSQKRKTKLTYQFFIYGGTMWIIFTFFAIGGGGGGGYGWLLIIILGPFCHHSDLTLLPIAIYMLNMEPGETITWFVKQTNNAIKKVYMYNRYEACIPSSLLLINWYAIQPSGTRTAAKLSPFVSMKSWRVIDVGSIWCSLNGRIKAWKKYAKYFNHTYIMAILMSIYMYIHVQWNMFSGESSISLHDRCPFITGSLT